MRPTFLAALVISTLLALPRASHADAFPVVPDLQDSDQLSGRTIAEAPVFVKQNAKTPLRVLPVGTVLQVLQETGDWTQIEFKDPQWGQRIGWVQRTLIRVSRPQPALTTPELSTTVPSNVDPVPPAGQRPQVEYVEKEPAPRPVDMSPHDAAAATSRTQKLKNIKIHGYVTEISSPTSFEIEDYRITSGQDLALDFDNAGADVKFALQDLHVGVEVQITGVLDEATGELRAKSLKLDLDQFRVKPLTAIISHPPMGLAQTSAGWTGDFIADGQRIHISPTTRVLFRLSGTDKALQKAKQGKGQNSDDPDDAGAEVLHSLDQVTSGMSLTYQGKRDPVSGIVQADKVTFMRNDLESGEARLWKSLKVQTRSAKGLNSGELKIDKVGKFKLLPNDEVQNYVRTVGSSLIPQYQRDLPASDARKIPFEWYVVENKAANAFALANGTVVVNSGLLAVLDNEAQLAAVLGHEMAHATQEHTWRQLQFHKTERMGLAIAAAVAAAYGKYNLSDALTLTQAAIQNGYSRNLENQADRVGLEYMTAAGYDPREAPRVWKQMTKEYGNQATNVFWSSHDNNAVRRSYLMNELRNNYQGVNFVALKVNENEFHKVQLEARDASGSKVRVKVK
jgi:hypothetical protein